MLLGTSPGAARTWRVERDGSGDFTTIQPAVDACAPGDTVLIGPGRYTESSVFAYDNEFGQGETYVGVAVSNLTLIGAHRDSVVIGPDVPNFDGFDPKGIAMQSGTAQHLRIERLTVQYVREGLRLRARAEVLDCAVNGCEIGVVGLTEVGASLERCVLTACTLSPVFAYGVHGFEILDSQFGQNDGRVLFSSTEQANVRRCSFDSAGVKYEIGASGTVEDSSFNVPEYAACVDLSLSCTVQLARNRMLGTATKVVAGGYSTITGTGNLMGPTSLNYMMRLIGETHADFHGNDIVPGAPEAIHLESYMNPQQPVLLDFSDNWWGTTDTTAIAAKIWDGNDDPALHATVRYQPLRDRSVPAGHQSVGGLKARFRR